MHSNTEHQKTGDIHRGFQQWFAEFHFRAGTLQPEQEQIYHQYPLLSMKRGLLKTSGRNADCRA